MRFPISQWKYFLLFLFLGIAEGCSTLSNGDRYNGFGPLFSFEEKGGFERCDLAGPIFTHSEGPGRLEWGIRPFFYYLLDEKEDLELWEFLYPLGRYRITKEERYLRFTPLISSMIDLREGTERPSDSGIFPLFWGKDKEGNPYGGFFPFYGTFRNKFGRDYIRFIMWPVYSESIWGDTKKTSILWPIFSLTEGPGREGIKVWPLFGWDEREDEFFNVFALWPIFFYQKADIKTERPSEFFSIFPFYVRSTKGSRWSTYFLWPFFHYEIDEAQGFMRWDIPWPILGRASSPEEESFHLWPIWGYKKRLDSQSYFLLWPIYQFKKERDAEKERVSHRFLLLSQYVKEFWNDEESAFFLRVWPILYLKRSRDGEVRFHAPEIIPIDDEGFDRNWGPILRPLRYQRDRNGNEELNFLWGIYHYWMRNNRKQWDISFLISVKKYEDKWHFSLMKGLFEYTSGPVEQTMRLLYLPWPIPLDKAEEGLWNEEKNGEGGGF